MKNNNHTSSIKTLFFLCLSVILFNACDNDDEQIFEKTRLFSPVLNEKLFVEGNAIIADMASFKDAIGYTLEVSRDTFKTIDYTIKSDTSYVRIDKNNIGKDLYWNIRYQVRAMALETDSQYDSKFSVLGDVRTEVFPSILNIPNKLGYDVTDVAARVTWETENSGKEVTGIKVFLPDDLGLENPLFEETIVTEEQQGLGESFVYGLEPATTYQIAIYSGSEIRGWVNYTTKVADFDPTSPGVIDLSDNEDPGAVVNAVASAADGDIILVKRGVFYDGPSGGIDKSITIRAAYGFGEQKARLLFSGNFDLVSGANIDHLRFIDLECRGTDWSGKYVINASQPGTLNELSFDNCYITNFRGIGRIKTDGVTLNNFNINNSVVDSIGSYGVFTQDKSGSVLNNIKFTKSTFNHTIYFLASKNNSESLIIEDCTLANINEAGKGRHLLRWRESGQDNITNGITIKNTIIGLGWDKANNGNTDIRGIDGLENTIFSTANNYTVSDFNWYANATTGEPIDPIVDLPIGNANVSQSDLWVDAENNDFNFKDSSFPGKYDTGDPRWRVKL
ncbi:DUF5123 domain-containing protein [Thalassobellus suaedae]|uniref:DUF5123 domain-containing protein n=1 Tax=Thalassobellus suaedae TaxID=3074124 RepID=A0ABY9XT65_9FLAO|nr:DUF5123 domain-containing protein [Flavobacteriaceae bacterium HL-DH14]